MYPGIDAMMGAARVNAASNSCVMPARTLNIAISKITIIAGRGVLPDSRQATRVHGAASEQCRLRRDRSRDRLVGLWGRSVRVLSRLAVQHHENQKHNTAD